MTPERQSAAEPENRIPFPKITWMDPHRAESPAPENLDADFHRVIEAKFISASKPTPMPELYALRARLKAEHSEVIQEKRSLRSSIAKKAWNLRNNIQTRFRNNAQRKTQLLLIEKSVEIDIRAGEVLKRSQLEGVATIEAICLSVFGQIPNLPHEIFLARLSQNFEKLITSGLSKVVVAPGFANSLQSVTRGLALVEESDQITPGAALLHTRVGTLEINIMEDLIAAFAALKSRVESALLNRDKND